MRLFRPFLLSLLAWYCLGCEAGDEPVMPDRRGAGMAARSDASAEFTNGRLSDGLAAEEPGCPCFTQADLDGLRQYSWSWGWWSDVPGCKDAPFDEMLEVWVADATKDRMRYNIGVQAGRMGERYHLSWARFNHQTGRFDEYCSLEVSRETAHPCMRLLGGFIRDLRASRPDWDYCVRFP